MKTKDISMRSRLTAELRPILDLHRKIFDLPDDVVIHDLAIDVLEYIIERSALTFEDAATLNESEAFLSQKIQTLAPSFAEVQCSAQAKKIIESLRNTSFLGNQPFTVKATDQNTGLAVDYEFNYMKIIFVGGREDRRVLVPEDPALRVVLASLDPESTGRVDLAIKAAERAVKQGRLKEAKNSANDFRRLMIAASREVRDLGYRISISKESLSISDTEYLKNAIELVGKWHKNAENLKDIVRQNIDKLLAKTVDAAKVQKDALELTDSVQKALAYASGLNGEVCRVDVEALKISTELIFSGGGERGYDMENQILPAVLNSSYSDALSFGMNHGAMFSPPKMPHVIEPVIPTLKMIHKFWGALNNSLEVVFEDEELGEEIIPATVEVDEKMADEAKTLLQILLDRHGAISLEAINDGILDEFNVSYAMARAVGIAIIVTVGDPETKFIVNEDTAAATVSDEVYGPVFFGDGAIVASKGKIATLRGDEFFEGVPQIVPANQAVIFQSGKSVEQKPEQKISLVNEEDRVND